MTWDSTVHVRVASGPGGGSWELALRIPEWAETALSVNGIRVAATPAGGWWVVDRDWRVGHEVVLVLPLQPRLTAADPRLDAARGSVALEYGPLVYCLESVDNPGHRLDDITIDPTGEIDMGPGEGALAGLTTLRATGHHRTGTGSSSWWPYRRANSAAPAGSEPVTLTAVPYYTWGNRTHGAMRIWVPTD